MSCNIVKLPYEIEFDNDFLESFSTCLELYMTWCREFLADKGGFIEYLSDEKKDNLIKAITIDGDIIKRCVNLYYSGDIVVASWQIKEALGRVVKGDTTGFIKSELDQNYCCRLAAYYPFLSCKGDKKYIDELRKHELTFFRARKDYYNDYKEMYHIPLDKRDLVGTERFSVPGIPCLYLGNSAYDVWLELGRPAYCDFNVSAIKLTEEGKKLTVLNLTATPYLLHGLNTITSREADKKENLALICSLLRIYPFVIATSIRNKLPKGKFRSDYIISHLIMMNIKSMGIDGVAYLSKRIEDYGEDLAIPQLVNIALPAFEPSSVDKKYGTVCEKIEITRAANYEEFLSLELEADIQNEKNSYFAKTFLKQEVNNDLNGLTMAGRRLDYHDTGFYRFENYLCSQKFNAFNS